MRIKVGTRGSPLALIQTRLVTGAIAARAPDIEAEVVMVRTEGDRNRQDSLLVLGGRGVFVRDIEDRLLAGEFDLAVHSLKDLPTTQPAGLVLAAIPARGDVRDALVARGGRTLATLPAGAVVGSSSQRRSAQVLALRPDLMVQSIRGNVETRLRKLDEGQYDAIVLAAAGLERMGLAERITEYFSLDQMLPAVGQGALAVECRADDTRTRALLAPLDDGPTRAAVSAERAFLRALGGGCTLPIGAYAELAASGSLTLRGLLAQPDGQRIVRGQSSGPLAQPHRGQAMPSEPSGPLAQPHRGQVEHGPSADLLAGPHSGPVERSPSADLLAGPHGGEVEHDPSADPISDAEAIGAQLAARLLSEGGAALMKALLPHHPEVSMPPSRTA